jgi:hypothetical protein
MTVSRQLEEAVGIPVTPQSQIGSQFSSVLLRGLKLAPTTWQVLRKMLKNMSNNDSDQGEMGVAIQALGIELKTAKKRAAKKIEQAIRFLEKAKKNLPK